MNLEKMLKALGEPMRFQIYNNILERKHCVRSLSKKLGISEPAISQHLKVMREAGFDLLVKNNGYHTHYLPKQDAIDFLMESFLKMQKQSLSLDRNATICHCEFRKKGQQ